jgi:sporulation protein YlmC with PRC-barrel domain
MRKVDMLGSSIPQEWLSLVEEYDSDEKGGEGSSTKIMKRHDVVGFGKDIILTINVITPYYFIINIGEDVVVQSPIAIMSYAVMNI